MAKTSSEVYQLKITLKGIKPPIWRRVQVTSGSSFHDLHLVIQDAMGWEDNHLHGFEIISPKTGLRELIGPPEGDMPGEKSGDEEKTRLSKYFGKGIEKATYVYDYGDDWIHEIKLEKILPTEKDVSYPICTAGKRACPPEDIGGVYGYYHLLDVMEDPKSEEYQATLEWLGEEFNPDRFSPAEVVFYDERERARLGIEDIEEQDHEDAWDEDHDDSPFDDEEGYDDELEEEDYFEADDYPDDMDEANSEALEKLTALFTSDEVRSLFEKAKRGDTGGLNEDQKLLVLSFTENMHDVSLAMNILADQERYPDEGEEAVGVLSNVFAQARAKYQIIHKDPIEAFNFFEAMTKKGLEEVQALHSMADIYFMTVEEEEDETSMKNYRKKLDKLAKLTPKKMLKELYKELDTL